MNSSHQKKSVMIITGEASGDLHGSRLVKAIKEKDDSIFFFGIGGKALKEAGATLFFDSARLSVVGLAEVLSKISDILEGMRVAKRLLKLLRPDLLILIDFPDFNLHVAAGAKKLGIPVLYYVSPQLWAWRSGRVKKIKKRVDHMAVILPFEEDFYKTHGVPVTFVGHPLLDHDYSHQADTINTNTENIFTIGILPGSRDSEVERLLPIMLESAHLISEKIENTNFIISIAPSINRKAIENIIDTFPGSADFKLESEGVDKIFGKSDLVVATSGTVTLEAAIAATPMVIIYKMSPITFWLGRTIVNVKFMGLANLIADEEVVPELFQQKATPGYITATVCDMINNSEELKNMKNRLLEVRKKLGGPGASERTADIALRMLND